jgi:hypothetical protein
MIGQARSSMTGAALRGVASPRHSTTLSRVADGSNQEFENLT